MRALILILALWHLAAASHAQSVDASADETRASLSVEVAEVTRGPVTRWLFAEGIAQAARKEFLQFRQPGRVIEIAMDTEGRALRAGSRVTAGTVLARLDPSDSETALMRAEAELVVANQRLRAATATRDQARADFDRQRHLAERGVSTRAQSGAAESAFRTAEAGLMEAQANVAVAEAEVAAARRVLERTVLAAPFDGVIALMNLRVGDDFGGTPADANDAAQERAAAIVLIDDAEFDITLHLPPFEAVSLAEGRVALVASSGSALAARLRGQTDSGAVASGRIWSISPSITLQRRAVTVVVRVDGGQEILRDGGIATVWVEAAATAAALRVPYDAVMQRGDRYYAYVVDGEHVVRRNVTLGLGGLDHVEVVSGLDAGDRVVIRGQHRLSDGVPIRVVEGQR